MARIAFDDEFEMFWKLYPARGGLKRKKQEAYEKWLTFDEDDREDLLIATEAYACDPDVKRGFAKDPIVFLRKDRWRDYVNPEVVADVKPELQRSKFDLGDE